MGLTIRVEFNFNWIIWHRDCQGESITFRFSFCQTIYLHFIKEKLRKVFEKKHFLKLTMVYKKYNKQRKVFKIVNGKKRFSKLEKFSKCIIEHYTYVLHKNLTEGTSGTWRYNSYYRLYTRLYRQTLLYLHLVRLSR